MSIVDLDSMIAVVPVTNQGTAVAVTFVQELSGEAKARPMKGDHR